MSNLPAIPDPPQEPAFRRFLTAIKESLETFQGTRGDPLDRAVTWRALIDGGVVDLESVRRRNVYVTPRAGSGTGSAPTMGKPTNLQANGALANIILTVDGTGVDGYSHTEFWRADTDNLSNAVKVGTAIPGNWADDVGSDAAYYYWARFVNIAGEPGPFNATAGTLGRTGHDPAYVRDLLTSRGWLASHAYREGEVVAPSTDVILNGQLAHFQVTTAGISGSAEPTWSNVTALGGTITDGTVTWVAIDAGNAPFITGTAPNGEPLVIMRGAVMEDASIESAKIKSLAADKIVAADLSAISADLGSITAGSLNINGRFVVDSLGNTTIRSSATGARLEVTNDVIRVYDANGVLRVKLGKL